MTSGPASSPVRSAYRTPLLELPVPGDDLVCDVVGDIGALADRLDAIMRRLIWTPGDIKIAAYHAAPAGWLLCDGSEYSRLGLYSDLFNAIGYQYGGAGDMFAVPNLVGRCLRIDRGSLGIFTPGADTVTLGVQQIPAHNHGVNDPGHVHPVSQSAHNHGGSVSENSHAHNLFSPGQSGQVPRVGGTGNWLFTPGPTSLTGTGRYYAATGIAPDQHQQFNATAATAHTHAITAGEANVSVSRAEADITTANAGGSTAHNNVPASFNLNAFIKT